MSKQAAYFQVSILRSGMVALDKILTSQMFLGVFLVPFLLKNQKCSICFNFENKNICEYCQHFLCCWQKFDQTSTIIFQISILSIEDRKSKERQNLRCRKFEDSYCNPSAPASVLFKRHLSSSARAQSCFPIYLGMHNGISNI